MDTRWRRTRLMVVALLLTWTMITALCVLSSSCANMQLKPVQEMTPKEKSLAAIKIYNGLVESYKAKLGLPNLSAAEKKVLNYEYATIQKTWPAIKAYDDFVQGLTPTVDDAIISQINQFLATYRY